MAKWLRPAAPRATGLLLKVRGSSSGGMSFAARNLSRSGEVLMEVSSGTDSFGAAPGSVAQWVRVEANDEPWRQVHSLMRSGFALGGGDLISAEPEYEQQWVDRTDHVPCVAAAQDKGGGRAVGTHDGWHLDAGFSGLADARGAVPEAAQREIVIAHLDTGYDAAHAYTPRHISARERNFVAGEGEPDSARDATPPGPLHNFGHGTGTIGILAGPKIGGAPGATVLPIRVADGVVRFRTGTVAQGFDYAIAEGAHVLSMSMGGLASDILADAVNKGYARGMVMVTAAGNNFSGLPIRSIVYPARMRRVVAACGVMADGRPYAALEVGTMEGCYGPAAKMATAVSGFTPNIPWPEIGCGDVVGQDGQGTSAATPQVAAAVALWLAHHGAALKNLPYPWMMGEAARQALFRSASLGSHAEPDSKLGWGSLRANAMLEVAPLSAGSLSAAPEASASWAWLKLLSGEGVGFAAAAMRSADRLVGLELAQLVQRDPSVGGEAIDPEGTPGERARRRFLTAAEASELASPTLKRAIGSALGGTAKPAAPPKPPPGPAIRPIAPSSGVKAPPRRRLRIFALDPSLGGDLNAYDLQVATIDIPNEVSLAPGPVGEYLEVVDVDPATDRVYSPVDLNAPNVMLQDGLAPSEGNPAFHQQMVYAVAMRTIENFEKALGRKALWAPRWSGVMGDPNLYVGRLRIYPHALRQGNAYYSPDRKALLFGYFPAESRVSDLTPPGTMVFTCLSADVVAHETTHALLDGQARTFREASNPDVRAFHEAFADIVALFQQFTYTDLVRRQIAGAHGKLSAASLLGGLAKQFGEGSGKQGPLRRYLELPKGIDYGTTFSTHERGSILTFAVYQAFLAIVERRTADLVRLATAGSGILPQGALHPDLVERLTKESTKAARHVLRMCIRALDYCPPMDLTFGEFLRALITADFEQVPDDPYGYRVAFLESFRKLQMLPRNLRTVSVETLRWGEWQGKQPDWLDPMVKALNIDVTARLKREEIFDLAEGRRDRKVKEGRRETMRRIIERSLRSQEQCDVLGLQHELPRYDDKMTAIRDARGTTFMVDNLRVARRVRDDGELATEIVALIVQRRPEPMQAGRPVNKGADGFWFRGGATVIIDLAGENGRPMLRYAIRRPIVSPSRLAAEREYRSGSAGSGIRSMYFGAPPGHGASFAAREPFAIMHAKDAG